MAKRTETVSFLYMRRFNYFMYVFLDVVGSAAQLQNVSSDTQGTPNPDPTSPAEGDEALPAETQADNKDSKAPPKPEEIWLDFDNFTKCFK